MPKTETPETAETPQSAETPATSGSLGDVAGAAESDQTAQDVLRPHIPAISAADTFASQGNYAEAVQILESVLALDPDNAYAKRWIVNYAAAQLEAERTAPAAP